MARYADLRRRTTSPALLLTAALAGTLTGCAGVTHNPSYVPHLFPFGKSIPTHARPSGFAYFKNYDPHACRLEVKPIEITSPVNVQQVVFASVLDKAGTALRKRRVEWLVDGAGSIVEVDESGIFGRGYKVDNHYAVSYTDCYEHTIKRGNEAPEDDFTVYSGQSWAAFSSQVEGDTRLTVYAPEINNWDHRTVNVIIHWVDAEWRWPQPVAARFGSPAVLSTQVFRHTDHQPLSGYRVRYRLIDGPPAVFVPRQSAEETAVSDLNGMANAALMQAQPSPGVNRVAIEIVRAPDPTTPSGSGIVLARGEVRIDWQAPQISLSHAAPPTAALGSELACGLSVTNTGQVESREITLRDTIPDGLQYVRSEPPAVVDGNQLVWTLAGLPPGRAHSVQAVFRTLRAGPVTHTALATTRDGLRDEKRFTTEVGIARLDLKVTGPESALLGAPVEYQISISNAGPVPATNLTLVDTFDIGLEHETRANPVKKALGTLGPGETRTERLTLTPTQAGRLVNRVAATADGNQSATAEHAVAAQRGQLKIDLAGPAKRYLNRPVNWSITLVNTGEATLSNIVVRDLLPPELTFVSASDGGTPRGREVVWSLPPMRPRDQKILELITNCTKVTPKAVNVALATAELGLQVQAESAIEIDGLPAFRLDVRDTADPVEVGGTATYYIDVVNQGTLAGDRVEIAAVIPPQFKVVNTRGPTRPKVEGDRLTFPVLETLPAGQKINYGIDVQAVQPGDARVRVELRSTTLREPIMKEESTTIYNPGGRSGVIPVGPAPTAEPPRAPPR